MLSNHRHTLLLPIRCIKIIYLKNEGHVLNVVAFLSNSIIFIIIVCYGKTNSCSYKETSKQHLHPLKFITGMTTRERLSVVIIRVFCDCGISAHLNCGVFELRLCSNYLMMEKPNINSDETT